MNPGISLEIHLLTILTSFNMLKITCMSRENNNYV